MSENKAKLDAAIAAAEAKYGDLPPGVLAKIAQVESRYGENLVNPRSSARGPFQFMRHIGPEFGLETEEDRMDFDKSTDAAARLTLRNKKVLEDKLGRPVTAGELYLAHQQGANGALKLLANPDRKASEVVGANQVKLNGGDPNNMSARDFANKWISKVDGGGRSAPEKKADAASQGGIGYISAPRDFYSYDPRSLERLNAESEALDRRVKPAPRERASVSQLAGNLPVVEAPAEKNSAPAQPKIDRKETAILQGLSTYQKLSERTAPMILDIDPVEDTVAAPSGLAGEFSQGVSAGLHGMNADMQYFGAILDTIAGNEVGAKSSIFNARQSEEGSAQALAGMQSFEQFLNAPTFDGFITQVVSSAGQVAPSAVESIASALVTGGLYSITKTGLSLGTKTVAKSLVKDMISKKAKGAALDKTEDAILDNLYKNFKHGAIAGAFGSEYTKMSGSAFAEFGDAGVDLDADRAVQSLLIGAPQAAIGVAGEAIILKSLANLALKKSTRTAGDSVLKRFAQDVAGTAAKSGFTEGLTEVGQESISIAQRVSVDPTYTQEEQKLRIAQAAFAGFFGGGAFGGGAAVPAAGAAALRRSTLPEKVLNKANDMLKKVSEARVETDLNAETKGATDGALSGATAPESPEDIAAQIGLMLQDGSPKKAVWASESQSGAFEIEPGQTKTFNVDGKSVHVGNIPGQGNILSTDPAIVYDIMTTYELGGDLDAARAEALGYTSSKTGDTVVRVADERGNIVHEQLTDEAGKVEAATRAEEVAAAVPNAVVDITPIEQALEDRTQRVDISRKEVLEVNELMNSIVASIEEPVETAKPEEPAQTDNDDGDTDEDSGDRFSAMSDSMLNKKAESTITGLIAERGTKHADFGGIDRIKDVVSRIAKERAKRGIITKEEADATIKDAEFEDEVEKQVYFLADKTADGELTGPQTFRVGDFRVKAQFNPENGVFEVLSVKDSLEGGKVKDRAKLKRMMDQIGRVMEREGGTFQLSPESESAPVKTKKMEMQSDPTTVSDEEQSSQDEIDAAEARLQEAFAAGDLETATVVETAQPNPKAREGFEQAFALMVNSVPAGLRDVIDNYRQFKDKLDTNIVERVEALSLENPETVFMFRETEDGAIEIVRNDTATDRDTYLEREAVAAAIKMVHGMSKVANQTGIWFKDAAGKIYRGTFKRRNPKTRAWETVEGSFSNFYLQNTNSGAKSRLLNLGGTGKTKANPRGRSGLMALAQAGMRLNAQTDRAFQGPQMTQLQQLRSGLETMLGALARAGYDIMYTQSENSSPVRIDDASGANGFKYLQGEAAKEVFAFINGQPITVSELFSTAHPFEESGKDFDPSTVREEVSQDFEFQTVLAQLDGRVEERGRVKVAADPAEQFAIQEDKKKRKGGVTEELAEAKEEQDARREQIAADKQAAIDIAKDTGTSIAGAISDALPPLPSDVNIKYTQVGSAWMAEVTSPRFQRKTVTAKSKNMVIVRAHELAVKESDSKAIRYGRLTYETAESTDAERQKYPEISGAGNTAIKDQTSVKKDPKARMAPSANSVRFFGNIGKLTGRVMSIASSHFRFGAPVDVMTLKYISDNFENLTGPGKQFERARENLADAIEQMNEVGRDEPGRVILGPNRHLIILRDEPVNRQAATDDAKFYQDDAEIGAVLSHEIGHIVFQQEFDKHIQQGPTKSLLWRAYQLAIKQIGEETGAVPEQYTNDKNGFEEWYADQVMAFVQNEARQARNVADGTIKKLADAFRAFYEKVNDALKGRLKLFTVKKLNPSTGKNEVVWSFADYMNEVTARHKNNKVANNEFGVVQQMIVKSMVLNLQPRLPAGAVNNMQRAARNIMSTGNANKMLRGLANVLYASTDFMGKKEHGEPGQKLRKFFGTLSQSTESLGWNKRELQAQNRFHNELADILGIDDRTNQKEWDSPRVRAIMMEAYDERIDTANLTQPEAKRIREFYEKLADVYMRRPGGRGRTKYWIKDFQKLKNYGGPRMWNADKIARNEQAFVTWLEPRLRQTSGTASAAQRAKDIFDTITQHTMDQSKLIERLVQQDLLQTRTTNPTPARVAQLRLEYSMKDRAVVEVRDRVLRDARRGVYTPDELVSAMFTADPSNPEIIRMMALPSDQKLAAVKKYWMQATKKIRLTPGMDPALRRELAAEVSTIDAYNGDPNDPNGWLLPPTLAHAQYMHYIARRVEYEKLGAENTPRGQQSMSGADYVISLLEAIPEEFQPQVDEAIMANLGKFGENMSNGWRLVNSVAAVWTVFTTLLFTTLSSVTDIAGIATRSKEFNNLGNFVSNMWKTLSTREFQELARSVGVVTSRTQEHMMIGVGELDYANRTSRAIMNGFFRYTGLEFYTKFTRSFATGMGREFIVNTAHRDTFGDREKRYLAELGLTREDVLAWEAGNQSFETPVGEKVRAAIARFADEAVIRPDASQRPTWASNPYLQTVWQLKSYYYGFGKTVMGGLGREIKNRHSEDGNFNGAAGTMLLLATTIIPLTMFGFASREWAKWLFQLAIPGVDEEPFSSSMMDGLEYPWEIFKRTGVLGPFALGLTTMEAFQYEGIAAPFTANVPMFDLFDDFVFDGDFARPVPVLNNIQ